MENQEFYYPRIEIKNGWTLELWPGVPRSNEWEVFDYYGGIPINHTDLIEQCQKVLPELAKLINDWLLPAWDLKIYLNGFDYSFIINHKETSFIPEEKKVIIALGSYNFLLL